MAVALGVEQHGIFGRRRKHAALFEADDEEVRPAGVPGCDSVRRRDGRDADARRHLQRLHALADEAQRRWQRARERPRARSSRDVVEQRGGGAVIERALPRGRTGRGSRARPRRRPAAAPGRRLSGSGIASRSAVIQAEHARCLLGPARWLRRGLRPTRSGSAARVCVVVAQAAEREAIGGAAPARLGAREQSARPGRREAVVVGVDLDVAGLQQPAQVAGGEVGLDPVAEAEQRAARPRLRGRDAAAERDRPLVPQRLLPDQRDVRVRGAGDLHLIERRAGREDAAEDLFDFGFAAAGVEQPRRATSAIAGGAIRNASGMERGIRRHESTGAAASRRGTVHAGSASACGTMRSPGIASISRRCSGVQSASGSSVQQSCGWIGHQSGCGSASS